jgi:hypothetical protein
VESQFCLSLYRPFGHCRQCTRIFRLKHKHTQRAL